MSNRRISFSTGKVSPASSGSNSRTIPKKHSQRLALEDSILKATQGNVNLTSQATKSAVGFQDAKKTAHKDSLKKQKQAWESPPDTPLLSKQSPISTAQRRFEKVQDFLYPEHLEKLKEKFEGTTGKEINLDEFIEFFKKFPELQKKSNHDIKTFFDKIDCYSKGKLDWDSFCTYMYLELYEQEDAKTKAKEVTFQLPATPISGPHRDTVCRMCYLQDGSMVSCSQDGTICIWTSKLKPKRRRKTDAGLLGKPKWISDMAVAPAHGKIILTTGDNEIQFFEMINFEPYCQISNLEFTPLKVFFWSNPLNKNECILLVGDDQGTVTIFCLPHLPEAFKLWKQGPKKKGMPTFVIDRLMVEEDVADIRLYRWKLHSDWVTDLKYFDQLRVFASSACDSNISLVMGTPSGSTPVDAILRKTPYKKKQAYKQSTVGGHRHSTLQAKHRLPGDQRVFRVHKGISSFDYCHLSNILATGGMDQAIRLWNPFVPSSPIGVIYGHGSPIFNVKLDPPNGRIYSIGNDNTLKVWDIVEQSCLGTVLAAAHKVHIAVEAMLFNPVTQCVVLATDHLYHIPLIVIGNVPTPTTKKVCTHRQSVTTLSYSDVFNLVITTSSGSDVKVWNINNGELVFEYASVHGDSCITAADIDFTGKRLVTAAINGEVKIWNFNNGHCLLTLNKGNCMEVCDVKFVAVNQIKYIVAVGWDKRVNVFSDVVNSSESFHSIESPMSSWLSSSSNVHKEDITCVELILPNLLATASFDGEIILWNIITGHVSNRLIQSTIPGLAKPLSTAEGDHIIMKILCLKTRQSRLAATVVASGPAGYVHFWNYRDSKHPAGWFQATKSMRITDMATDSHNKMLITSDKNGFVSIWNIEWYCVSTAVNRSMNTASCIVKWRAHTSSINSLLLVENQNILLTGSDDCSVRVWTTEGHFIGTLGQPKPWYLGVTGTYQYPMAPEDVLSDPLSVPDLKRVEDNGSVIIQTESSDSDLMEYQQNTSQTDSVDEEDEEMISKHGLSLHVPGVDETMKSAGKRLRHLRMNSAKSVVRGYDPPIGSYASLLFQDLEKEPVIEMKDHQQSLVSKSIRL